MDDETRHEAVPAGEQDPHALERASAGQVRDVSGAAEREAGEAIDELASGLDRAQEQPGYGREGQ